MSHEADIINAYRAQLQKIRDAFELFDTINGGLDFNRDQTSSYRALVDAIDSMEAQTIEDSVRAMPEEMSAEDIKKYAALRGLNIPDIPVSDGSIRITSADRSTLYQWENVSINGVRYSNRTPHRED